MVRIILPLALMAAAFFGPWKVDTIKSEEFGDRTVQVAGAQYVTETVECFKAGTYSFTGDCAPRNGMKGLTIFAAIGLGAAAAALGVIGLLPFVGRLTSVVTTVAGIAGLGAMGYGMMSNGIGGPAEMWGAYATGGLGLLTLVSGLGGMRGD